jgi:hypothetical protein
MADYSLTIIGALRRLSDIEPDTPRSMTRPVCLRLNLWLWLCLLPWSVLPVAHAWDMPSHRITAAIAFDHLPAERRDQLHDLLRQHPRFQPDFAAQMPPAVAAASRDEQTLWLLGQAALWPDLIRNLPGPERQRYHRARWHYIDGRWMSPPADTPHATAPPMQGNVYVGMSALPAVQGEEADAGTPEREISNMMMALGRGLAILRDPDRPAAERAVALCWVMHLTGDIHQPLHAGALMSPNLFPEGDRGGNAIRVRGGNLHAYWDRALRGPPVQQVSTGLREAARDVEMHLITLPPAIWLQESRQLLQTQVYTPAMLSAIGHSEREGTALPRFTLDDEYDSRMQRIARERLQLAGRRLAELLR